MPVREIRTASPPARTVRRRVVRVPPPPPAAAEVVAAPPARGRWLPSVALAVLLVLALTAAVMIGQRWYGGRQLDAANQAALAAAKQTTVDFLSISASTVDADLQRIVGSATGDFRDEFTRGLPQVRTAVVENNVQSRGTVLRAGLVSGDRDSAVVLVAADATVRNTRAPEGRLSHYRIQIDVALDGGRWLVSRLQFVG